MPFTEIILTVFAAAFSILVLTLIPTILAVKRAVTSVASLSEMMNNELRPTIKELTSVLVELKTVGGGVAEKTDDVKRFMASLGETGDNLHSINRSVAVVTGVLGSTSAFVTGAKVTGKYLMERYLKKRGGK